MCRVIIYIIEKILFIFILILFVVLAVFFLVSESVLFGAIGAKWHRHTAYFLHLLVALTDSLTHTPLRKSRSCQELLEIHHRIFKIIPVSYR